jgi:dolichol-phosphate mannosyltransferase
MLVIVLPAFNEEDGIARLLGSIRQTMTVSRLDYRVLVVNDGSRDGTGSVARGAGAEMAVEVVDHEENRGLAAALATGLKVALGRAADDDVVVTMDADNSHPPDLIPSMMARLCRGVDVVIASRFVSGAQVVGVPPLRRLLSRGASVMLRCVFPTRGVKDFTSGYRAYRAGVLRDSVRRYGDRLVSEAGFSVMLDVLLKLRRQGVAFAEVPLVLRYDLKRGPSKMRVARTVVETLRLIARRRLGAW